MTPRGRLEAWLSANIIPLLGAVATVAIAWGMASAQLAQKIDRAEIERALALDKQATNAYRSEVAMKIGEMGADIRSLLVLVCQDRPKDSQCQRIR